LPAPTSSSSRFTCSAVITSGSFLGAFGVRTSLAALTSITRSRSRKRNRLRTAASLRRMLSASRRLVYIFIIHSRRMSRSMARGSGGGRPGGERYSTNCVRSDSYARMECGDAPLRAISAR
jgi:hypothetical protein